MNIGNPGKGSPEININLHFSTSMIFLFMSSNPRISRRRRGLSPEATPIFERGRRKIVLSTQEITLRITLSDFASSPLSPIPITFNMTSVGSGSGTGGASSPQPSASLVIGSIYNHQFPIQSTTNPAKVIKNNGLFQFEEDSMTTPWHVSTPLNLAPATHPLPKFKEHLPRFSGNNIVTTNEHLVAFSNSCHNIGANDHDTCMHLFFNSLKGKDATNCFDLPPKIISTWEGLVYWFKSTYGQSKSLAKQLRE
jgi:hypothetical protein